MSSRCHKRVCCTELELELGIPSMEFGVIARFEIKWSRGFSLAKTASWGINGVTTHMGTVPCQLSNATFVFLPPLESCNGSGTPGSSGAGVFLAKFEYQPK